ERNDEGPDHQLGGGLPPLVVVINRLINAGQEQLLQKPPWRFLFARRSRHVYLHIEGDGRVPPVGDHTVPVGAGDELHHPCPAAAVALLRLASDRIRRPSQRFERSRIFEARRTWPAIARSLAGVFRQRPGARGAFGANRPRTPVSWSAKALVLE